VDLVGGMEKHRNLVMKRGKKQHTGKKTSLGEENRAYGCGKELKCGDF